MKNKCFNISIYTVFYNKTKFNIISIKFEFRILEASLIDENMDNKIWIL